MRENFQIQFSQWPEQCRRKTNSTEKPCSSSFEWYCLFVPPRTSSGCHNSIKLALFAWPLFGHKQDFGPKHIFRHYFHIFESNGVLLASVTKKLIANKRIHFSPFLGCCTIFLPNYLHPVTTYVLPSICLFLYVS
jgi:hypothetical protein